MGRRSAFTLIEVLVSILLISLVFLGLYGSLDIQRRSNQHLHEYLQKALKRDQAVTVLYRDLLSSDGNLSITQGEFDRLCIANTAHSLYGLPNPKVCWLVLKDGNQLLRVEGGNFRLPLKSDDHVAIDRVMGPVELFDITRKKGELLVALKVKEKKAYAFLMQGIEQPKAIRKIRKKAPPQKNKKPTKAMKTKEEGTQ